MCAVGLFYLIWEILQIILNIRVFLLHFQQHNSTIASVKRLDFVPGGTQKVKPVFYAIGYLLDIKEEGSSERLD